MFRAAGFCGPTVLRRLKGPRSCSAWRRARVRPKIGQGPATLRQTGGRTSSEIGAKLANIGRGSPRIGQRWPGSRQTVGPESAKFGPRSIRFGANSSEIGRDGAATSRIRPNAAKCGPRVPNLGKRARQKMAICSAELGPKSVRSAPNEAETGQSWSCIGRGLRPQRLGAFCARFLQRSRCQLR